MIPGHETHDVRYGYAEVVGEDGLTGDVASYCRTCDVRMHHAPAGQAGARPCCAYASLMPAGTAHQCESTVTGWVRSDGILLITSPCTATGRTSGHWHEMTVSAVQWDALPSFTKS